MSYERLEKMNFITSVFSGCLWSLDENELDELHKQALTFYNEQKENTRQMAHMMIDKFLGDSYN